jgi:hypothetical protein
VGLSNQAFTLHQTCFIRAARKECITISSNGESGDFQDGCTPSCNTAVLAGFDLGKQTQ